VDRSGTSTHGTIYVAWHDGRNLTIPDAVSGTYGYADVLVSRSLNGGQSFEAPVRVNNNVEPIRAPGTDQYQPGIAVNPSGVVGTCFYDRRRDPLNFLIDRFCATSTDGGTSWGNQQITATNFAAVHFQDVLIDTLYMGDYDGLASDFTGSRDGFIGAYGDNSRGNPDVNAAVLE
jgi:hypothetical protein